MKRLTLMMIVMSICAPVLADPQVFTIGTIMPGHSGWAEGMRAAASEIKASTNGRVQLKYRFSQKSYASTLKNMRTRRFQGGVFTSSALQEHYPDINLYSLPLIFDSEEEASFVRSRMDEKLIEGLGDAGYVSFGFAATGFAMFMSNDPVRKVSDIKGKKVWIPEGDPISYSAMRALGVTPSPESLGAVLTGLQLNHFHSITASPIGALIMQWHTKVKYLTEIPLSYTIGFMVVDKEAFNAIDSADQAIVQEVMTRVYADFNVSNLEDDKGAKEALLASGIVQVYPDQKEFQLIRAILAENNRKLAAEGIVSEDLFNEMMRHIDEYRRAPVVAK